MLERGLVSPHPTGSLSFGAICGHGLSLQALLWLQGRGGGWRIGKMGGIRHGGLLEMLVDMGGRQLEIQFWSSEM